MKKAVFFILLAISNYCFAGYCIKGSSVNRWEALSHNKIIGYKDTKYVAIIFFNTGSLGLKQGEAVDLKAFNPSICAGDTVLVNNKEINVFQMELAHN